jgi:hypothetical protein
MEKIYINKIQKILKHTILLFSLQIIIINISFCQVDTTSSAISIDDHQFMINSTLGSPFVSTFYRNLLGAGQTVDFHLPEVEINGRQLFQLAGDIVYLNLALEYQQQIRDWMALHGKVQIFGRVGTQAGGLISQGVNLAVGYNLGWKFQLFRNKVMAISSEAFISNSDFTQVDLINFIKNAIDSGYIAESNDLVHDIPLMRGGLNFNYAYAFSPTFGLSAKLQADYGESYDREEEDAFNLHYGIALDMDLLPKYKVPIGFLVGFYHTSMPEFNESVKHYPNETLFQFGYTGNENISISAEFMYRWYRPEYYDTDIKFVVFNLNTTLYF